MIYLKLFSTKLIGDCIRRYLVLYFKFLVFGIKTDSLCIWKWLFVKENETSSKLVLFYNWPSCDSSKDKCIIIVFFNMIAFKVVFMYLKSIRTLSLENFTRLLYLQTHIIYIINNLKIMLRVYYIPTRKMWITKNFISSMVVNRSGKISYGNSVYNGAISNNW